MDGTKGYYLDLFAFEEGHRKLKVGECLKNAIKIAQKKIEEGYDKVSICDANGRIDRVYWNINGKACRL